MVKKRAQTEFPANVSEIPISFAALTIFVPNAIPTLGKQDNIPAKIAMDSPTANTPVFTSPCFTSSGFLVEPAIEQ